jgi:selenide, water dikinase
LRQLPPIQDKNLLVGSNTADDAGVYRLDRDRALVQTVDFFTPIVDDPFLYGQIAAANAFSDVYAMGGRPLTALNVMGVPADVIPASFIVSILKGGAAKAKEANCALVGGHTIRNPEPIYGLAVTGLVSPRHLITNDRARTGDILILTKPLGTGIITTGIKRNVASPALAAKAVTCMRKLNSAGPDLAERGLVSAGTDVTGFGLLGHLISLCRASGVSAEISARSLPLIGKEVLALIDRDCIPGGTKENLRNAESFTDFGTAGVAQQYLMADAQTSGGLLLCVPPRNLGRVLALLKAHRVPSAAAIGTVVRSSRPPIRIRL